MFTFAFLFILTVCPITADKYVKLYNIVCETSSKWIENATCRLKVIGRNVVVANMEMDTKNPFRNISVHFQVFKFYSQFRPYIINTAFNICDILKKRAASNFYINTIIRILSKFSNAIQCPLSGHIYAKNLEIKYEYLRLFVEERKYRLNFKFYEGLDTLANVTMYAEIINKYSRPTKKV
ncbi:hypothetical protein ACFFRR_000482 [Megaselia abdita]